ncbi:MAG: ACT domain-containing protein [Clostridia bacterium]
MTLDYEIKNGDRRRSSQAKIPRDLAGIGSTSAPQAKNKISQWFKREFKRTSSRQEMVENMRKQKYPLHGCFKMDSVREVQVKDWESVLAAIGHGGLKEGQVVNRLYEEAEIADLSDDDFVHIAEKIEKRPEQAQESGRKKGSAITVRGIHDVAVRFSKCCNPVPGDEIIGYITRGRGVSIHRTDCINIIQLEDEERQRLIDAEWEVAPGETTGMKFESSIQVLTEERKGILADISSIINNENITIVALNVRHKDKQEDVFNITVEISSKEQLEQLSKDFSDSRRHEIVRTSTVKKRYLSVEIP